MNKDTSNLYTALGAVGFTKRIVAWEILGSYLFIELITPFPETDGQRNHSASYRAMNPNERQTARLDVSS